MELRNTGDNSITMCGSECFEGVQTQRCRSAMLPAFFTSGWWQAVASRANTVCHVDFTIKAALRSDSKTRKSFALPAKFYNRNSGDENLATLFFWGPTPFLVFSVSIGDSHEQHRYSGSQPVPKCLWRPICLSSQLALCYLHRGHRVWTPKSTRCQPSIQHSLQPPVCSRGCASHNPSPVCWKALWPVWLNIVLDLPEGFVGLEMLNSLHLHVTHVTLKVASLFSVVFFFPFMPPCPL